MYLLPWNSSEAGTEGEEIVKVKNIRLWKKGNKSQTLYKHQQLRGCGSIIAPHNPQGPANKQEKWWKCAKCESENPPTYKKCGACGFKPLFGVGKIKR